MEKKKPTTASGRVVHAKGSGAYGTFTVTHDIPAYIRAKVFSKIGKQTRVFVRFSTVGGEKGSADTERDPHGFAVKFYTEDGNWNLLWPTGTTATPPAKTTTTHRPALYT